MWFVRKIKKKAIKLGVFLFTCSIAMCVLADDDLPWDSPLQTLLRGFTGTTAHLLILIAIVLSGLGFAMGEHGSMMRRAIGIVFGGSIAIGAASLAATLHFT
jgi:type IV secretion system protein VirB2